MISVILYGRNDAHGYNLHRRAALSLNCLAEVLTDPDDELIFVDYNTPDELPTFIEAISDTLTDRCLALLRVLRVPAAIHDQRFAARTHLPAVEPVARNVAARRANPSNRWLLSTNTDMIFVPLRGRSMSEICRDLPDGFYGLPRFELPEWLWERLPRSDPARALADIERLGPALGLDEATTSHEWIRFDAPGDCQLMLRDDLAAIDGFDEEMLLGYHVDSNLSRRLLLHRGSIESLEEHLAGYHCNHNRTRTVYHGRRVENDLHRFFFSIDQPELPVQRATWGLAGVTLEAVPIRESVSTDRAATLIEAIPTGPRSPSDALKTPLSLSYDPGHVLPFIADALFVSPRDATVGYLGVNPAVERMLAAAVDGLGFERPLAVASFDDVTTIEHIAGIADIFIIDLGVDSSQGGRFLPAEDQREVPQFPSALSDAPAALYRLIELERARCAEVKHPRPMVLVNSSAVFWDPYVLAQFDCSYTTVHSRVRRATVKVVPDENAAAEVARAQRMMRWYGRLEAGADGVVLRPGQSAAIAELWDYAGFGTGWAAPEDTGIWTQGTRSELRLAVDGSNERDWVLSLFHGIICVGAGESLTVTLLVNDELVAARDFNDSSARVPWRVDLPARVWAGGKADLAFLVDEPYSPLALGWSTDDRLLGIHLRSLTVEEIDRSVRLGETVVFCEGSDAGRLLGNGWSTLEPTGVWTGAEEARLALRMPDTAPTDVELVLQVVPFVTAEHRELEVEVWAGGQRVAVQVFRYGEAERDLHVPLSEALIDEEGRVFLDLHLRRPARPVDLGLSTDPRRLGLYLRSLTVREPGAHVTGDARVPTLRKLRKQLVRSLRT